MTYREKPVAHSVRDKYPSVERSYHAKSALQDRKSTEPSTRVLHENISSKSRGKTRYKRSSLGGKKDLQLACAILDSLSLQGFSDSMRYSSLIF